MSTNTDSFSSILRNWPDIPSAAAAFGLPTKQVRPWVYRNSIPPKFFECVAQAAARWNMPEITLGLLAQLHRARYPREPAIERTLDHAAFE